jgi:hypothetical protein
MNGRQSSNDLSRELTVLSDVFSDLAERLSQAARQLHAPGTPPPESLVEELSQCQRDFVTIRDRTRELAGSLHVACPAEEHLQGLQNLATLLDETAGAEVRRAKNEEVRRRALSVLERVNLLSHVSDAHFPALRDCQDKARELHGAIGEGSWTRLPAEAEPLAEGEHAFAHLLTLIEDRDELSDDHWASLHESVGTAFGKSIAAAAARMKLVLSLEHAASGVGT